MNSAIYSGWVRHRRRLPVTHVFRYRLFMMFLDLAELENIFARRWLWSSRRFNLAQFRRTDHLGPPAQTLDDTIRQLVFTGTGKQPQGSIRLLTHMRYFGYCFNPVSFYFCFDNSGTRIEAIVAEVSNTPWRELHAYVLSCKPESNSDATHTFHSVKIFMFRRLCLWISITTGVSAYVARSFLCTWKTFAPDV